MAIGLASDFTLYQEQFNGGLVETLVQNTAAFNAASMNTIRLTTRRSRGQYLQESFFTNISSLVTRQDTTAVTTVTDTALAQDENVSVKLNRKVGPVANTIDSFRKISQSLDGENGDQILSFKLGGMIGKAMQVEWLDRGLESMVAATLNQSALSDTDGAATTIVSDKLVDGLALFGDAANRINMWVMHSKPFYDLVKDQMAGGITNVADVNFASATPLTLGRPVLVTDSESLRSEGSPTGDFDYYTLGLSVDGIVLEDSEEQVMHSEVVTGLESLVVRLQGEFAFNCGLKGYKWDISNGGANPTQATLTTGSNWDASATADKDRAGVIITTK